MAFDTDSSWRPALNRPLTNLERGVAYPSPFFDISSTYIPRTVKALFRWCQFYFWTNPLISAVCHKLSEYPITDLVLESHDKNVRERWEWLLFDQLQYKSFEIGVGLDYHVYGNAYISVVFPFRKYLICSNCGHHVDAFDNRKLWRFTGDRFILDCPECGRKDKANAEDEYMTSASGIRIVRWDPIDIEMTYHETTGDKDYYYTPPQSLRADILAGKRDVVARTPQIVLEAIHLGRPVRMNPQAFFHMARTTVSSQERGLGVPVIYPVLKDTFYLQVLKKAQEALSMGNIVPLRIFFPQPGGPMTDPATTVNLSDWRSQLEIELRRFRYDPLYTPILPFPVGHQVVGGEGRALLLSQEIEVWSRHIIVGMGYPPSLVFGDVAWSGSSVALRMLENTFLRFMENRKRLLDFVIRNIATGINWQPIDYHMKPFKMADDLAKRQLALNLSQWGKISDRTLLAECDYDFDREQKLIREEQDSRLQTAIRQSKVSAQAQGEAMVIQAGFQMKAQIEQQKVQQANQMSAAVQVPGAVGGPQGNEEPGQKQFALGYTGMIDARVVPQQLAQQLQNVAPAQRQLYLQQLQGMAPETHQQVMRSLAPAQQPQPLPEQKPPRRESGQMV